MCSLWHNGLRGARVSPVFSFFCSTLAGSALLRDEVAPRWRIPLMSEYVLLLHWSCFVLGIDAFHLSEFVALLPLSWVSVCWGSLHWFGIIFFLLLLPRIVCSSGQQGRRKLLESNTSGFLYEISTALVIWFWEETSLYLGDKSCRFLEYCLSEMAVNSEIYS